MKKTICIGVAVLPLLSLSSCGSKTEPGPAVSETAVAGNDSVADLEMKTKASASPASRPASITISHETTWVVEPVNSRGRIDFVAAINQTARPVSAEQNAAVGLVQVLGTGFEDEELHRQFVEQIGGTPDLAMRSTSMISQVEYAQSQRVASSDAFFDHCSAASSRPWSAAEFPDVDLWLKSCESDLDMCLEAIKRPRYYYPLLDSLDAESVTFTSALAGVLLPLPQECRGVARALTARGMRKFAAGDAEGASRDILATFRLGRLVGQGFTLVEFLVGTAIESMAQDSTIALINSGKLGAADTVKLLAELANLPPFAKLEDKLEVSERLTALDLAVAMADNGLGVLSMVANIDVSNARLNASAVDWDTALRTINVWYDRLGVDVEKPTYSERAAAIEELNESLKSIATGHSLEVARIFQGGTSDAATAGEQMGHFIAALTVPGSAAPHVAATRCQSRNEMLLLSLQLHRFRLANGQLPETLEAASLAGLTDRFTGEAMVYRCGDDACALYARGPNQQDDGGPSPNRSEASDDVGYSLANSAN